MKIIKSFIVLLLSVLMVSGCDSDQQSPASKKAEPVQSSAVETDATTPVSEQQAVAEVAESKAEPVQQAALSGEKIYQKSCVSCHGAGIAGAPKLGDAAAWSARIAKGKEALYHSAKNGVTGTAMMARGTCGACSDAELEAAVDFMMSSAE